MQMLRSWYTSKQDVPNTRNISQNQTKCKIYRTYSSLTRSARMVLTNVLRETPCLVAMALSDSKSDTGRSIVMLAILGVAVCFLAI